MAVDRLTRQVIAFVTGKRGRNTGRLMWNQIRHIPSPRYYTDYWEAYCDFLPKDKHVRSKKETYTVEGRNARLRHYTARFHRKTKCCSKADHMIETTLKLAFYKFNYS